MDNFTKMKELTSAKGKPGYMQWKKLLVRAKWTILVQPDLVIDSDRKEDEDVDIE